MIFFLSIAIILILMAVVYRQFRSKMRDANYWHNSFVRNKKLPEKMEHEYSRKAAFGYSLIPLGIGVFVVGIGLFALLPGLAPNIKTYEKPIHLAALSTSSKVSGTFFLGSGYVDSELTYNYLQKEPDGGYTLNSVEARYAEVYTDAPAGTGTLVYHDYALNAWWAAPFTLTCGQSAHVDFHVPRGSIDSNYKVTAGQ